MINVLIRILIYFQRKKLYRYIENYGLSHPKTYQENCKLDRLINLEMRRRYNVKREI